MSISNCTATYLRKPIFSLTWLVWSLWTRHGTRFKKKGLFKPISNYVEHCPKHDRETSVSSTCPVGTVPRRTHNAIIHTFWLRHPSCVVWMDRNTFDYTLRNRLQWLITENSHFPLTNSLLNLSSLILPQFSPARHWLPGPLSFQISGKPALSLSHEYTLQWRHNEHDSVSNHQPGVCLLNRLFGRR